MSDYFDHDHNSRVGWSAAESDKYAKENPWLIMECTKLPVSGNVAFIDQWRIYSRHPSKEARDTELTRLHKAAPKKWLEPSHDAAGSALPFTRM